MKRRFIFTGFIFALFLILVGLLIVNVEKNKPDIELPTPTNEFYVYDETDTLDRNTKDFIINMNKQFEHLPGEFLNKAQIVVVMVNSLEGLSIEEYSNKLFSEWGIGDGEKDNGALLLIAKNDGEIRIEVGYGLEPVITDGIAGRILDNQVLPHLANKDFNDGVLAGFVSMIELIAEEDGVTIQGLESFTEESYEENVYPDDSDSIIFEDLSTGQIVAIIVPILLFVLFVFLLSVAPFVAITVLIIYIIKGARNGTIEFEQGSSSSRSSRNSRSSSSSRSSSRSRSSSSRGGGGRSGGGGSSRRF